MKPHNVQPWFIHYLPPAVSIKSIHTTGLKMYWNACTFTQQVTWLNCYLKTGRNRKYNSFLFCLQYGLDGRLPHTRLFVKDRFVARKLSWQTFAPGFVHLFA